MSRSMQAELNAIQNFDVVHELEQGDITKSEVAK
jgi:hypothetical protein